MNPWLFCLLLAPAVSAQEPLVRLGIDRPEALRELVRGRTVGIVANHSSVNAAGEHLVDLLVRDPEVNVRALFAPEHGIRGNQVGSIADGKDEATGLPVHSLYGKTRKPTAAMLSGIDTLVFDIQDVGARFYTFISTMKHAMEAAFEHGLRFIVLDRPNPLGGEIVEGPLLERDQISFIGCAQLPIRHGMTVGELARLFARKGALGEGDRDLDLHVVRMEGWKRSHLWSDLGMPFPQTSPNMPTFETALVYPGMCLLEGTNLNEGRGTEAPFLQFGAPFFDERLAKALEGTPGIALERVTFTPHPIEGKVKNPRFDGELCHGLRIRVTDARSLRSVAFALRMLEHVRAYYPDALEVNAARLARTVGNRALVDDLMAGRAMKPWIERSEREAAAFARQRRSFLLY